MKIFNSTQTCSYYKEENYNRNNINKRSGWCLHNCLVLATCTTRRTTTPNWTPSGFTGSWPRTPRASWPSLSAAALAALRRRLTPPPTRHYRTRFDQLETGNGHILGKTDKMQKIRNTSKIWPGETGLCCRCEGIY